MCLFYGLKIWIKFLSFVSVFCSVNLSCFMIAHLFKDKHKVAEDINSLNLLVLFLKGLFPSTPESSRAAVTYCKK